MLKTHLADPTIEKSVFQCSDCRSIFRFDEMKQFATHARIHLDGEDVIYKSNQFAIPPVIEVVSNIPFCPYCHGTLVLLNNQLLAKFNKYLKGHRQRGTVPLPTLSAFLDFVLDVFDSAQRSPGDLD